MGASPFSRPQGWRRERWQVPLIMALADRPFPRTLPSVAKCAEIPCRKPGTVPRAANCLTRLTAPSAPPKPASPQPQTPERLLLRILQILAANPTDLPAPSPLRTTISSRSSGVKNVTDRELLGNHPLPRRSGENPGQTFFLAPV
jgi:hypothetical protein